MCEGWNAFEVLPSPNVHAQVVTPPEAEVDVFKKSTSTPKQTLSGVKLTTGSG